MARKKPAATAEVPSNDAQHAADVLGIKREKVLAVRRADEGLYVVTEAGQKILLDDEGTHILKGPGAEPEVVTAAEVPAPAQPDEDLPALKGVPGEDALRAAAGLEPPEEEPPATEAPKKAAKSKKAAKPKRASRKSAAKKAAEPAPASSDLPPVEEPQHGIRAKDE